MVPGSKDKIESSLIFNSNQERAMSDQLIPPFHLAFPSHDLSPARSFYGRLLGIVAHLVHETPGSAPPNAVDGHSIPVPTATQDQSKRGQRNKPR
jgi:hypothetical protein